MHVMPSRTALAAALTLALAAPGAFAATRIAATSPTPDAIEAARPNASLLILRAGIFDPAAESLDFPAATAAPAGASSYAIVQFQPGHVVDRKALARRGIQFLGYVPNNAYYVKLPGLGLDALRNDPAVRWAGTVEPGMKLAPELWSGNRDSARQADGTYEIRIHAFRGVASAQVAAAIEKLVPGVRITAQSERADAPQYVRASVAMPAFDHLVRAASSIDGVSFVEPFVQPVYHNSGAIGAIQGNATTDCAGSGTPCGPTPIWDHGIFGSGQIAGIADSGTTPNAAWFTTLNKGSGDHVEITLADDPAPPLPDVGLLYPDSKILAYWVQPGSAPYDAGVFHGTHTTGTLVGDASGVFGANTYLASTPLAANHELADGMAPNAQLLFQDIGADASTSVTVLDFEGTIEQSYNGGARLHNNSWGAPTAGTYNGDDVNLDVATHKLENMLVVMSAGNDGPSGHTIGSPGNAKNALTVGALQHGGLTGVASFSSRGPTADGRHKPDIMAPGSNDDLGARLDQRQYDAAGAAHRDAVRHVDGSAHDHRQRGARAPVLRRRLVSARRSDGGRQLQPERRCHEGRAAERHERPDELAERQHRLGPRVARREPLVQEHDAERRRQPPPAHLRAHQCGRPRDRRRQRIRDRERRGRHRVPRRH